MEDHKQYYFAGADPQFRSLQVLFVGWSINSTTNLPRYIALMGMLVTLVLTIVLWQTGTYNYELGGAAPSWAAEFKLPWIQTLGINIHLAVDGLSLSYGWLDCTLRCVGSRLFIGARFKRMLGFFHLNLLWSLGGVIGVFLAIDLFLFFFFWEMMLVPIYFLIALWGHKGAEGKSRVYAANQVLHLHAGCRFCDADWYPRSGDCGLYHDW